MNRHRCTDAQAAADETPISLPISRKNAGMTAYSSNRAKPA
jgi:hypothetical protein